MAQSRLRFIVLAVFLTAALGGYWARLFQLQVLSHGRFSQLAELQHNAQVTIPAERGRVYDRRGEILATSVTVQSVFVNPAEITDAAGTSAALGRALGLDRRRLAAQIGGREGRYFLWIKRHVTREEEARVRSLALTGVYFREEQQRFYPNGPLAAQVVGFTGIDQHGLAGVEFSLENRLAGRDGWREERRDGLGRAIYSPEFRCEPAAPGSSVVLTIDLNIQDALESAIERCQKQYAPKSVTGIVLDPRTGEILALAERPTFDPNRYGESSKETWRLKAITDPVEPGSMFKPFVFAPALIESAVRVDEVIFCGNGVFTIGKRVLHDHHPYGNLTGREVVVKSSNIGMAKIGLKLGSVKIHQYLSAFGFGERTGIELAGEEPGTLVPLARWSHYTLTSVPMGHEVSVTPLQVATAFAAFCNGGLLVKPRLIKGVVAQDGTVLARNDGPTVKRRVLDEATAKLMVTDVLHRVVKEGTGRLADLEDYTVAGKTGTAQKLVNGQYSHNKYVSSFICAGPTEDPRAVVLIVVNEPSRGASFYGGTAAAPYAGEVLKATLDYMFIDERRRARPVQASLAAQSGAEIARAEAMNAP